MTIYNPIKDTSPSPPSLQTGDNTNYAFGLNFKVTANCQINGIWWYCASGQYTNPSGLEQIALYTVLGFGSSNANYVTGSVSTISGAYSTGWNLLSFSSPISLTSGVEYCAVKSILGNGTGGAAYSASSHLFDTGAFTNGVSEGPVLVYSSGSASDSTHGPGSSNQEPYGNGQQQFYTWGSTTPNLTTNPPNGSYDESWYGMDVQIQTSGGGPTPPNLLMASFP